MNDTTVLLTKITPPKLSERYLIRPRVQTILLDALQYRLTLVQAGAGYGKSTALAALASQTAPFVWYQVNEEDAEPLIFLTHLCHTIQRALPEIQGLPFSILQGWNSLDTPHDPRLIIDQILNALSNGLAEPCLMVIDDAHFVCHHTDSAMLLDRLVGLAPPDLHILLSDRAFLQLPNLHRWKARGQVLLIDQNQLAFQEAEIGLLFSKKYDYELTPAETRALGETTEGWAIALQLIWQNLRSGTISSVQDALMRQRTSLEGLFDVLANEVFEQQPADVRQFLLTTSILRSLTPAVCDTLRESSDSAAMLAYLRRQELFVIDLADNSLRYHNIFQNFLRTMMQDQLTPGSLQQLHQRAARYYQRQMEWEAGIYHFLQAADYPSAAAVLENHGETLLSSGRFDRLSYYLEAMPPAILRQYPALIFMLGELARFRSQFQEALGWYRQAEDLWRARGVTGEITRALRGQARVYLDTVNPAKAEAVLQQALRLSDGTEDREALSRLYELMAENRLNAGQLEAAEHLRQQAASLRNEGPSDAQLNLRVLLRTGRFKELRRELELRAEAERQHPPLTPRAHRETQFLQSLFYAFQGEAELALKYALEGTRRGEEMDSPFVTAVGHMRQGHALMLLSGSTNQQHGREQFEKAIQISQDLSVPRLRVEAHWGLCRGYGYAGDIEQAQLNAEQGITIAEQAGDEWIASLVRLTMGASLVLAERYELAAVWLNQAIRGFEACSDTFVATAARLWLALLLYNQNDIGQLAHVLPVVLKNCRELGYEFLLTRRSLIGVPDPRALVPLLILARQQDWEMKFVSILLDEIGLPGIRFHPGYQLRIKTLGQFQLWRGEKLIPPHGWRREKSRQMFQLFLTYQESPLDREQIF
ncbi:MAG: transcriptional regulator, partial [Anaerolineales bacterium]